MAEFSFTAEQLSNLFASAIDYHMRDKVYDQAIYDKHLLRDLEATSVGFPGNLEKLTWPVQGDYGNDGEEGFSGDEVLSFSNPAYTKQAEAKWYERHAGLTVTFTELKKGGISVADTTTGTGIREHANSAATRLAHIWDRKIQTRLEARAIARSKMFWGDGSASPKDVPGIRYWVVDDPTVPLVVGGLDQAALPWWRNRAVLGIPASPSTASAGVLIEKMQTEFRHLIKYGGRPNKRYAGSDFLDQLERELRARGSYTETGWAKNGQQLDVSMGDVTFKNVQFVYEPELDNIGRSKYCYVLQIGSGGLRLMHMEGERDKKHTPARPENQMALYQSITWTGALVCFRRNSSGVYSIA